MFGWLVFIDVSFYVFSRCCGRWFSGLCGHSTLAIEHQQRRSELGELLRLQENTPTLIGFRQSNHVTLWFILLKSLRGRLLRSDGKILDSFCAPIYTCNNAQSVSRPDIAAKQHSSVVLSFLVIGRPFLL